MKITNNITFPRSNISIIKKQNIQKESTTQNNYNLPKFCECYYANTISFGRKKREYISKAEIKRRISELEEKFIDIEFATQIAHLPTKQYQRAIQLSEKAIKAECITELTELPEENYKQALFLAEKGIFDFHVHTIASFNKKDYEKALDLLEKGIDSDCVALYVKLTESEFKEAEKLLKEGHPPIVAAHFCKLSEEERKIAQLFVDSEAEPDVAAAISKTNSETQQKCIKLLQQGISTDFILEIANFNEKENDRLKELKNLKADDSCLAELAKLKDKDYKTALNMLKSGVYDNYINFIIEIENGKVENREYTEYRKRNYSQTTSFSLSLLSNKEIDALTRIRELHPIIRTLMEDEYEITIADIQNDDKAEAIFTKQMRTLEGTKITLVRTFNEYGEETKSRTEEYKDNSTSSILSMKSGTFRTKYDKYGEIKEMTEFVQDFENKNVTGVIHSKASNLLPGVFESTYYDISQFKEGGEDFSIDTPIEDAVISEGETISKVIQNNDGSITYTESIQLNEINTDRVYTEKKDEFGNIVFSKYEYKIINEDTSEVLMDISRTWQKQTDKVINKINGIQYEITFDDKNKTINITDGINKRKIDTKDKLPYYSSDVLWTEIKKLQADTILTIFDRIDQWNYCADADSVANAYMKTLSTGKNNSIICHEAGHLLVNDEPSIIDNEEFYQTYGTEMEIFQTNIPYNEQQYVQYFSPRADIIGADGADEFIAESNILLTTYGTTNYRIKTRTQFLEKYFPKTIAKIAEITGKNSRESLLK